MRKMSSRRDPEENDHILPEVEGGTNDDWNLRSIPRSQNREKGPKMPTTNDVLDSSNPARLAAEIDRRSLEGPFKHSRNKGKGFGGLPRG